MRYMYEIGFMKEDNSLEAFKHNTPRDGVCPVPDAGDRVSGDGVRRENIALW
jgi:hypothetical protein